MDAQELRNLQEAYNQVHQLDEAEGSYGQTPKAREGYRELLKKREATPAKGFRGVKGGKTASTERARTHFHRSGSARYGHSGRESSEPDDYTTRKKMTPSDRAYARQEHEYVKLDLDPYGKPDKPGGMPKGKKLERQKKTGVSAESYNLDERTLSSAETKKKEEIVK